jgi:NlpC/P60 family
VGAMGKVNSSFNARAVTWFALSAWLAGGGMAVGTLAQAQATSASLDSGPSTRLLSVAEGRAIAGVAQEEDQPGRRAQDCSHLVHETYRNAGFDYPYASSFELYAGHESFGRVRNPQAGDLVVWPGHVGIVLEPREHSFYSLVSTGLEAQDYEGTYWRSRGKPRFYRYKITNDGATTTAKAALPSPSSRSARQRGAEVVTEERSPVVNSDSKRAPQMAAVRSKVMNDPVARPAAKVERTTFDVPQSVVIAARKKQPTSNQVEEGILELSNAAGTILWDDEPSKLELPVVIFERLHVERLEIKRDHGWAFLQIDSRATIVGGEMNYTRRRERIRWELRRTESGWEAIRPADKAYVPSDVAVRNLAAQLAGLTERDGAAADQETVLRQESHLANMLSALLENK